MFITEYQPDDTIFTARFLGHAIKKIGTLDDEDMGVVYSWVRVLFYQMDTGPMILRVFIQRNTDKEFGNRLFVSKDDYGRKLKERHFVNLPSFGENVFLLENVTVSQFIQALEILRFSCAWQL